MYLSDGLLMLFKKQNMCQHAHVILTVNAWNRKRVKRLLMTSKFLSLMTFSKHQGGIMDYRSAILDQ